MGDSGQGARRVGRGVLAVLRRVGLAVLGGAMLFGVVDTAVGIERWGQRAGELGRLLGKHPDVVSRWVRMVGVGPAEDPALAEQHESLDRALAAAMSVDKGGSR